MMMMMMMTVIATTTIKNQILHFTLTIYILSFDKNMMLFMNKMKLVTHLLATCSFGKGGVCFKFETAL